MTRRGVRSSPTAAVLLLALAHVAPGCGTEGGRGKEISRATPAVEALPPAPPSRPDSGRTVSEARLPAEAHQTLRLIRRGGPFPYPRDGAVFGNRERLLPKMPHGYYREYTVRTPGSGDRGARRIVAGKQGELYYTDDHYRSFRRIAE